MQLLPDSSSRLQYKYEYNKFKHWCEEPTPHMNQASDKTMIVEISEKSKNMKSNTFGVNVKYWFEEQSNSKVQRVKF